MNVAVLQFPGSNCDQDALHAARSVMGLPARYVWHKSTDIRSDDVIIVPGGFSYGDYLRCGAVARFSPVMQEVKKAAEGGQKVFGICNGFQILCEAGLLPGALVRNRNLHFVCKNVKLRVEETDTPFTRGLKKGDVLQMPVAHGEGCYIADADVLKRLEANRQIIFRYVDENGQPTAQANPNGSTNNIAGICNEKRNVLGMMPHPERACEDILGCADGLGIFESLFELSKS